MGITPVCLQLCHTSSAGLALDTFKDPRSGQKITRRRKAEDAQLTSGHSLYPITLIFHPSCEQSCLGTLCPEVTSHKLKEVSRTQSITVLSHTTDSPCSRLLVPQFAGNWCLSVKIPHSQANSTWLLQPQHKAVTHLGGAGAAGQAKQRNTAREKHGCELTYSLISVV